MFHEFECILIVTLLTDWPDCNLDGSNIYHAYLTLRLEDVVSKSEDEEVATGDFHRSIDS